jgi:hypothetical protein
MIDVFCNDKERHIEIKSKIIRDKMYIKLKDYLREKNRTIIDYGIGSLLNEIIEKYWDKRI